MVGGSSCVRWVMTRGVWSCFKNMVVEVGGGGLPTYPKGRPHLCGRVEQSTGARHCRGAVGNWRTPQGPSTGSILWAG